MFSVAPTAKLNVRYANAPRDLSVARIEFRRSVELGKRALRFITAAVDISMKGSRVGVVWLKFDGPIKFSQRGIIVAIAPVIKQCQRQMCIRRSRSNR